MKALSTSVAIVLAFSMPLASVAQTRGGGRPGPGSGSRPAPAMRAPQPAQQARPGGGGFNLNTDFKRPSGGAPVAPPNRPAPIQNRPVAGRPPNTGGGNPPGNGRPPSNGGRPPGNGGRPPGTRPPPGGYPQRPPRPPNGYPGRRPPHTVIYNPIFRGRPAWGWNNGVIWSPAGGYYGGGFWGAFALGAASAFFYGSLVNGQQTYDSYGVAPGSPGAQLLANYQLTQTDCSQPDLVVIYGPQNSLICAYPSSLVGPGTYTVDPSGLTLSSQ